MKHPPTFGPHSNNKLSELIYTVRKPIKVPPRLSDLIQMISFQYPQVLQKQKNYIFSIGNQNVLQKIETSSNCWSESPMIFWGWGENVGFPKGKKDNRQLKGGLQVSVHEARKSSHRWSSADKRPYSDYAYFIRE